MIVVFRGSVTGEDWQTNFNAWLGNIDRPQRVKDLGFDKEIKIHSGFRSKLEASPTCLERKHKANLIELSQVISLMRLWKEMSPALVRSSMT